MTKFSIEKDKNKHYYGTFKSGPEMIWKTSEDYTRKSKAIKASCILAAHFSFAQIEITDNTTPGLPTVKIYNVQHVISKA